MNSICVFCGSSPGRRDEYRQAALALARALVANRLRLVYGGAGIGIMGQLADEVLKAGGTVIGVIPESLVRPEVAHANLTELHVTKSMHERKTKMFELADGFIALPGGMGTLEELCEILTWAQLGHHAKPCGVLNVSGYFDPLLGFFDHAVQEGFISPAHRSLLQVAAEPLGLLERFQRQRAGRDWQGRGIAGT